jgi:hypothetical protein
MEKWWKGEPEILKFCILHNIIAYKQSCSFLPVMVEEIGWIDTANQINNSWYKKTAVGVLFEKKSKFYGIMINHTHKLKIKDKLKDYSESVVAGNLQAFLVFLLFKKMKNIPKASQIFLCPDYQPFNGYYKYIQKCFSYHGDLDVLSSLKIKRKPSKIKSKAHSKVNKLYNGRRNPNYLFTNADLETFKKYFINQSNKKLKG